MKALLFFGALSAVFSWLFGFLVYRVLFRFGLFDQPNARSSHSTPTVRGGGIGIVIVVLLLGGVAGVNGTFSDRAMWLIPLVLLAAVSFADDFSSLSWKVRFSTHFVAAAVVTSLVWYGDFRGLHPLIALGIAGVVCLVLVAYANAFNFMDGINGLAAGQAAMTGIGTIGISWAANISDSRGTLIGACLVAGAAVGFLPHNFPRARMFMGDVGSVVLGFALASIAITIAAENDLWLLIPFGLLHANFILDTAITLTRRVLRGEKFHEAHREHFYQRLTRKGRSHFSVTLHEMGLQVIVVLLLIAFVRSGGLAKSLIAATIVSIWLLFFFWIEQSASRAAIGAPNCSSNELKR